jgi:hypothetical protein
MMNEFQKPLLKAAGQTGKTGSRKKERKFWKRIPAAASLSLLVIVVPAAGSSGFLLYRRSRQAATAASGVSTLRGVRHPEALSLAVFLEHPAHAG